MWRPQQDLAEEDDMRDPGWYPRDTHYNIYNKEDHERPGSSKDLKEHGKMY